MARKGQYMHQNDNLIDELFKTTAEVIYDTDMQHGDGRNYWPFHPVFLDSLVAPIVFKEILRIFEKLENNGYTLTDIAEIIKSPTKIANYQYLWPIKTIETLSLNQKSKLVRYFIKLLIILRNGEPFCERKRNLVWSKRVLHQNMNQYEKHLIDAHKHSEVAHLLTKLEGLLVSYAESLYYYMIDFSRMMHGPYLRGNRSPVFVKEYFHLQARELSYIVSDFPFDHFKEIGVYQNIDIAVFFMGHTHSNPSFPEAIQKFVIIVDDQVIKSADELKILYRKVERVAEKTIKQLTEKSNDENFLLKKGLDMFFYPLKPLYSEIGEDWRDVLQDVYKYAYRIKNRIKIPGPWGDWSKEKAVAHLLRQMDFWKRRK